jgi:extradiol dioxygenase family protein
MEIAQPILHLSLPVRDLAEARRFYADALLCDIGRERDGWFDVWFHGMQLTLHLEPEQVLPHDPTSVRHFGVTLDADELASLLHHLESRPVRWLKRPATDYPDTPRAQTKAMIADPSGNAIELKTYADPRAAFAN